jgi:prepilin-type N-terminal cleavage/methylation domain-containing protein
MRRPQPRLAFSLMELLIVVSMIGILAAIVVPMFAPDAANHLQAAAEGVANDLAYARSLAVANNSRYRVTFDPSNNSYFLTHGGTNAALHTLPTGVMGSPSDPATRRIVRLDDLPTLGTRVALWQSDSGGGGQTVVEFSTYGATTATQDSVIWLSAGGGQSQRFLSIHINPVTGLATVGTVRSTPP